MIELTEEQRQSIRTGGAVRVREDGQEYIVLSADVYDRLVDEGYDVGPWTPEELDRLREESVGLLDRYGRDV